MITCIVFYKFHKVGSVEIAD